MKVGDLVTITDKEHNAFGVSFGIVVKLDVKTYSHIRTALVCWTPEGFEHWWECHRLEVICKSEI